MFKCCLLELTGTQGTNNFQEKSILELYAPGETVRELMGKGKVFRWLPEHQFEFETVKAILSSNLLNHHFDVQKPVELLTDASRQNGLGYALCQRNESNQLFIVTCGSKSLTPTQQRYATIELECLAIIWAINNCNF